MSKPLSHRAKLVQLTLEINDQVSMRDEAIHEMNCLADKVQRHQERIDELRDQHRRLADPQAGVKA